MKELNDVTNEEDGQFQIRPSVEERFDKRLAEEVIHLLLTEELTGKTYKAEEVEKLSTTIANSIKARIRAKTIPKYKLICSAIVGEQRGAHIRVVARCLWDSATDATVSVSYENDSLFCVATVFAVYVY